MVMWGVFLLRFGGGGFPLVVAVGWVVPGGFG